MVINIKFVINGIDPIFMQVANFIEECIIQEVYKEEEQIPSTTEFSSTYKINPATVLKGFNLLESNGVLYKKRGIGVFVKECAKQLIISQRQVQFQVKYVDNLVKEARNLNIPEDDLINMIKKKYNTENLE